MRQFLADLHIHSVLSPCAAAEMTPSAIVHTAAVRGLDLIAICDHNTSGNAHAAQRAAVAAGAAVHVLAGIEITTAEEAHLVGLFPDAERAESLGASVKKTLPELRSPPKWMGPQLVMDESGRVRGREGKMLSSASGFSLSKAVSLIHAHDGLAIAAHVDRPSFSVTSQLGMIPDDVGWAALELSAAGVARSRMDEFAPLGFPLVSGSDSHSLEEIGCTCTLFEMEEPSFDEIVLALRGEGGRRCSIA